MTVKHVTGDLFSLNVDAIGHGVNCKGIMGAGIATVFRDKYPDMYREYRMACLMGQLNLGQVFVWAIPHKGTGYYKEVVYNIASQDEPGPNAELDALMVGVEYVEFHARRNGIKTVALPQIGCGIGGLDWTEVSKELELSLRVSPVEFQLVTYGE